MADDAVWQGAVAVVRDGDGRLLMVLQGEPGQVPRWSLPGGGREPGEDFGACCRREVLEETGLEVSLGPEVWVKRTQDANRSGSVEVHCFLAQVVGGQVQVRDPDGLIHDIAWQSRGEIAGLPLCYPEDLPALLGFAAPVDG